MQLEGKRIIVTGVSKWDGGSGPYEHTSEKVPMLSGWMLPMKQAFESPTRRLSRVLVGLITCTSMSRTKQCRGGLCECSGRNGVALTCWRTRPRFIAHLMPAMFRSKIGDLMFAINVRGTMLTNQVAARYMKESGGGLNSKFSVLSQDNGLRSWLPPIPQRRGLFILGPELQQELGGMIKSEVNAILPAMATPMYIEGTSNLTEEEEAASFWQNHQSIAMGQKYGDPDEDLGPVMVFLASDGSRFITGQMIPVDGGQTT